MTTRLKIFSDKDYRRWYVEVQETPEGKRHVLTVNTDTAWNDCPIKLPNGKILYDFPERVPAYAKRLTEQAFAWLETEKELLSIP